MTANQIAYWGHKESQRHNKTTEKETERHNRATESIQSAQVGVSRYVAEENARHNLVMEGIQHRTQVANAEHMVRQDSEAVRHNQETERVANWQAQIAESNLTLAERKQTFYEWERGQSLIIDQAQLENEERRTDVQVANAWTQGIANIGKAAKSFSDTFVTLLPILSRNKEK